MQHRHASLEDSPAYEALPYVWGDSDQLPKIKLGGQPCLVTPNLYSALLHIRRPSTPRTLWTEVLCIDQRNIAEWTSPAKQMGYIFSQVFKVILFFEMV
jgi:hypothetical protein